MSLILDGSNGITFPNSSTQSVGFYGFKNRIINGAMNVNQYNSGSVTITNTSSATYVFDRWAGYGSTASKFSVQQTPSTTETGYATRVGAGFINYLAATSLAATTLGATDWYDIRQPIEGLNVTDLGWGTSSAKTITFSFWAYSSLTGTFGGSITNSSLARSYPFSYSIPVANTWTQISVTIPGDTSGTWLTTNGIGIYVIWSLGSGSSRQGTTGVWSSAFYTAPTGAVNVVATNTATFYITGVQLEAGSTATSFDYRPYGTELNLCQRYYYKWVPAISASYAATCNTISTTATYGWVRMPVTMRTSPTLTTSGTASDYGGYAGAPSFTCTGIPLMDTSNTDSPLLSFPATGLTIGTAAICGSKTVNGFLGFNSEL